MAMDIEKIRKAASTLDQLVKHFGSGDTRHPSVHHTAASDTQKPHGNRPGTRTQETVLSAMEVMPDDFGDSAAEAQTDYFLRASGVSSPVVQVGDQFWLAPPNAVMLPERGAGENIDVDSTGVTPNTNVGEGLQDVDKLDVPGSADSEEGKRFLEAAAEYRKNGYTKPTTPRFEEMYGDQLRQSHPKRAPKAYGGLSPADQHKALKAVVAEKKRHKWAPLQHAQAVAAIGNVLQNFSPAGANAGFVTDLLSLLEKQPAAPGRRSGTTASTAQQPVEAPAETAGEEAAETADENAEAQTERAQEQRQEGEQRNRQRRLRTQRRLGQRLE